MFSSTLCSCSSCRGKFGRIYWSNESNLEQLIDITLFGFFRNEGFDHGSSNKEYFQGPWFKQQRIFSGVKDYRLVVYACTKNHVICIMMVFTLVLIKGCNFILVNCSNLIGNIRILQCVL
ncbi:hypothetical protein Csa_008840 [Cucumis sativus]|nr:hypothetical protein Csa_008840 [Cucumis sativus]